MKKYNELLKLARDALQSKFEGRETRVSNEIINKFSDKRACFVTLTEDNMLRGCIGSLEANQELWKDVVENAIHAGFHDYRFNPVSEKELDKIKIEISILTKPEKIIFKDSEDLLRKINDKMGIILMRGEYSATFLPQVWEQIPSKKEFLEQLSLKAGLSKDDWKNAEIKFYRVERVEE